MFFWLVTVGFDVHGYDLAMKMFFEGVIPEDQNRAGTVMVWDRGRILFF